MGGKESNKLQEAGGKNMSELMVINSLTASKVVHGYATGQIRRGDSSKLNTTHFYINGSLTIYSFHP